MTYQGIIHYESIPATAIYKRRLREAVRTKRPNVWNNRPGVCHPAQYAGSHIDISIVFFFYLLQVFFQREYSPLQFCPIFKSKIKLERNTFEAI